MSTPSIKAGLPYCSDDQRSGKGSVERVVKLTSKYRAKDLKRRGACKLSDGSLAIFKDYSKQGKSLIQLEQVRRGIRVSYDPKVVAEPSDKKEESSSAAAWILGSIGAVLLTALGIFLFKRHKGNGGDPDGYRNNPDRTIDILRGQEITTKLSRLDVSIFEYLKNNGAKTSGEVHNEMVFIARQGGFPPATLSKVNQSIKLLRSAKVILKGRDKKWGLRPTLADKTNVVPPGPAQRTYTPTYAADGTTITGLTLWEGDRKIDDYMGWHIPMLGMIEKQPANLQQIGDAMWPHAQKLGYTDSKKSLFAIELRTKLAPFSIGNGLHRFNAIPKPPPPPQAQQEPDVRERAAPSAPVLVPSVALPFARRVSASPASVSPPVLPPARRLGFSPPRAESSQPKLRPPADSLRLLSLDAAAEEGVSETEWRKEIKKLVKAKLGGSEGQANRRMIGKDEYVRFSEDQYGLLTTNPQVTDRDGNKIRPVRTDDIYRVMRLSYTEGGYGLEQEQAKHVALVFDIMQRDLEIDLEDDDVIWTDTPQQPAHHPSLISVEEASHPVQLGERLPSFRQSLYNGLSDDQWSAIVDSIVAAQGFKGGDIVGQINANKLAIFGVTVDGIRSTHPTTIDGRALTSLDIYNIMVGGLSLRMTDASTIALLWEVHELGGSIAKYRVDPESVSNLFVQLASLNRKGNQISYVPDSDAFMTLRSRVDFQLRNAREFDIENKVVISHGHDTMAYGFIAHLAAYLESVSSGDDGTMAVFTISKALRNAMEGELANPYAEVARTVSQVDLDSLLGGVHEDARLYATSLQDVIVGMLHFMHSDSHITADNEERKSLLLSAHSRVMRYLDSHEGARDSLTKLVERYETIIGRHLRRLGIAVGINGSFSGPIPQAPASSDEPASPRRNIPTVNISNGGRPKARAPHDTDPDTKPPLKARASAVTDGEDESSRPRTAVASAHAINSRQFDPDLQKMRIEGTAYQFDNLLNTEERQTVVRAIIEKGGAASPEDSSEMIVDWPMVENQVITEFARLQNLPMNSRQPLIKVVVEENQRLMDNMGRVQVELIRLMLKRYEASSRIDKGVDDIWGDSKRTPQPIPRPISGKPNDTDPMVHEDTVYARTADGDHAFLHRPRVKKTAGRPIDPEEAEAFRKVLQEDSLLGQHAQAIAKEVEERGLPETTGQISEKRLRALMPRLRGALDVDVGKTQQASIPQMVDLLFDSIMTGGDGDGEGESGPTTPPAQTPPTSAPPASPAPAPSGASAFPYGGMAVYNDSTSYRPLLSVDMTRGISNSISSEGINNSVPSQSIVSSANRLSTSPFRSRIVPGISILSRGNAFRRFGR